MRGTRRWSAAASDVENVFKDEVTQEELVKRTRLLKPHADLAVVLLERRHIHDSVAFVALLVLRYSAGVSRRPTRS